VVRARASPSRRTIALGCALREAVGTANPGPALTAELRALREALLDAVPRTTAEPASHDPERWLGPRLDALADSLRAVATRPSSPSSRSSSPSAAPPAASTHGGGTGSLRDADKLLAQVRRIERSLVAVVGAAVEQRADPLLAGKLVQIIELLGQLDARLSAR
jgi:hypothetical protein